MSWREAIDLAKVAFADTTTYLGAEVSGLTTPTSNAEMALLSLAAGFGGDLFKPLIPIDFGDSEHVEEASAEEIAQAENLLETTIIFREI